MASYLDKAPVFNPYVAQQPVKAMVEVGMQKQQQYDQGIEKIQNNINNIAGMDLARDVDKSYLKTKLNTLSSNLRTVAAGDFSNAQLTNSVMGMTNTIAKDENIQNAMYSTKAYRKGIEDMNAANKAGKGGPSNDWLFQRNASNWLNNQDITATFNDKYLPFTDYKKNALSVIKELTGDSTITDEAFTTVTNPKTGKTSLVLSDAIIRTKLAGVPASQIQSALMATLSQADFRQMEIDGQYAYSGVDDATFIQKTKSSYDSTIANLAEKKVEVTNAISQTTSVPEIAKLNKIIKELETEEKRTTKEYENVSKTYAGGNTDAAKAMLFTADFMSNFSQTFAHTELSQTYETSPMATMAWNREKEKNEWARFSATFSQRESHFQTNAALALRKVEADEEANRLKAEGDKLSITRFPGGVKTGEVEHKPILTFIAETDALSEKVDKDNQAFMDRTGRSQDWFDSQEFAYQSSGAVDPEVKAYFDQHYADIQKVKRNRQMAAQIEAKAFQEHGNIYTKIPKDETALRVTFGNTKYNYEPRDIVDFNTAMERVQKRIPGSGKTHGKETVLLNQEEAAKLSPKHYQLYKIIEKKTNGQPLSAGENALYNKVKHIEETVNKPYVTTLAKINKTKTEELERRIPTTQPGIYTLGTAKPEDREKIGSILAEFANMAEAGTGGLGLSPDFDVTLAREIAIDPKIKATLSVSEGTEDQPTMYKMSVLGDKGSMTFNVTPEQKAEIFRNQFEKSAEELAAQPYIDQIKAMGGYSTAQHMGLTTPISSHENAFIGKPAFPNVLLYRVSANVIDVGGANYSIRLNLKDPITKEWHDNIPYPANSTISKAAIPYALGRLTDIEIFKMINGREATTAELKQIQIASKNPL